MTFDLNPTSIGRSIDCRRLLLRQVSSHLDHGFSFILHTDTPTHPHTYIVTKWLLHPRHRTKSSARINIYYTYWFRWTGRLFCRRTRRNFLEVREFPASVATSLPQTRRCVGRAPDGHRRLSLCGPSVHWTLSDWPVSHLLAPEKMFEH